MHVWLGQLKEPQMDSIKRTTRRGFIKQMGFIGIGFSMLPKAFLNENRQMQGIPNRNQVNAWLRVQEDGRILILTGKAELGQGISTAIMQVAAEELNTTMEMVDIVLAETGITQNEGYTAGSRSIESSAMSVRSAAATARELLITEGAKKMAVARSSIIIENGKVKSGNREMDFYELLKGRQIEERLDQNATIKGKEIRNLVGKPIPRRSIEAMVKGEPVYVQDLRFPGMVHARIVRPSGYTSSLIDLNTGSVQNKEGFLKVIKIGSFIGVLAREEFQAIQFKNVLTKAAKWKSTSKLAISPFLKEYLKQLPANTETDEKKGDWQKAFDKAPIKHSASYFKPYIMHGSNGPSCAIAIYRNGKLDIWCHSQGVYPLRETLAEMLDLKENDIHIKSVPGSGCYGHNAADDVAAEAALLAMNYPSKHIRLQWMREDEHGWEPYGTAMVMELRAGLTPEGKIQGWKYDLWSDGHSTRPGGNPNNLLPARFINKGYGLPGMGFRGGATRNAPPYYNFTDITVQSHIFQGPLRISALRGLGAYANIFAIESFMEELAYKAQKHPLDFRLTHLSDPRAIACVQRVKEMTSGLKIGDREGLGFAFSRYKNSASYFAMATHVYVEPETGKTKLKKMWGVIDSGECINPDGLKNQTEGGMLQAASWALIEEVKFNEEHITSLDWNSYPMLRFPNIPEVEVEVIDRVKEPPLGAGEAAQGPSAAALLNAIYSATGIRIRDLPVKEKDLIAKS